jgi:hypothetical protein
MKKHNFAYSLLAAVLALGLFGCPIENEEFVSSTNNSVSNNEATLGLIGDEVSSSNTNVATAVIASGKIVITSVAEGTATITVSEGANNATIPVTVAANGSITIGTIVKYAPGSNMTEVPIANVQLWDYANNTLYSGSATVKLGYGDGEGLQYLTVGSVTDGIMTIDFSPVSTINWSAIPCENANSVTTVFDEATVSPDGVKMGADASLELFNGNNSIGYLYFFKYPGDEYFMGPLLVDQAVTITGESTYGLENKNTPYTADIHAESGVNFILVDYIDQELTTEYEYLPAGMKWYFFVPAPVDGGSD